MSITAAEFDYIRDLVRTRSAIVLDEGKEYLVTARLAPVVREAGVASLKELVGRLRTGVGGDLRSKVVEAMTTNETSFYRDLGMYEALKSRILPDLVSAHATERRLTVWSAACSTGQEPYSLMMMIREHFPQLGGWQLRVQATDLSEAVLEKARAGRYTQFEVNRGLPAALLARHFERKGIEWHLDARIRQTVDYRRLNLIEPGPFPTADLILLRNVLIYFDAPTKRQILGRVRAALRPGGWLILGASETPLLLDNDFERVEVGRAAFYRPRK